MKNHLKKEIIFCLFIFFVNLAFGTEEWSEERVKVLERFVGLNRKLKRQDKDIELFKKEMMELTEKNKNEIEENGKRIDQLEKRNTIKDLQIDSLKIQVEDTAILVDKLRREMENINANISRNSVVIDKHAAVIGNTAENTETGCPTGFELKPGDIPGWGQIGSNPSIEGNVSGCSLRCKNEGGCCSFEYSPTENKCNLNRDCEPTNPVYKDYAFCTKVAMCPVDHPFAYLDGQYCCKTNQEYVGSTNQAQIQDGSCDGIGFSRESKCCKEHAHVDCPHGSGCFDNHLAVCKDGWLRNGNDCYLIVLDGNGVTWYEAKSFCQRQGGILTDILDQETQNFIADVVEDHKKTREWWLGGNDVQNEGEFKWLSGEEFNYTHWKAHDPNNLNENEHCILLSNQGSSGWIDTECNMTDYRNVIQRSPICKGGCRKYGKNIINENRKNPQWHNNVYSAKECSAKCRGESWCVEWTWHHGNSGSWAYKCVLTRGHNGDYVDSSNTVMGDRNCE